MGSLSAAAGFALNDSKTKPRRSRRQKATEVTKSTKCSLRDLRGFTFRDLRGDLTRAPVAR
jgi:hypothetical protein